MMRRNKYFSHKVKTPEGVFDSNWEYQHWCELKLLQRAGKISNLEKQKAFQLIPAQYEPVPRYSEKTGKRLKDSKRCIEKSVVYNADFVYYQGGKMVVEDTKSDATKTKDYIIKRKLMLWVHGIRIKEVKCD